MNEKPGKPIYHAQNRHFLILGGILLLALGVRWIAMIELAGTPYFGFLLWDERVYHEWAQKIAAGTFSSNSSYEFPPLYAYVLSFMYRLFSPDPIYARALNIVIGVATCGLVYLIGTALSNRRVGMVSGLVAALYKPLILYSIVPLKTALAALCFVAVAYTLMILLKATAPKKSRWQADRHREIFVHGGWHPGIGFGSFNQHQTQRAGGRSSDFHPARVGKTGGSDPKEKRCGAAFPGVDRPSAGFGPFCGKKLQGDRETRLNNVSDGIQSIRGQPPWQP